MKNPTQPPYTFGDRTFHTKDSVRQYFLNRLIGMEPGDKASEEDSAILRGLLKLHTNRNDFGLFSDSRATFGVGTTGRGRTPKAFFVESGRFRAQVSVQGCLYEGVAEKNPFPHYGLTVADVAAAYPAAPPAIPYETCTMDHIRHLGSQRDEAQEKNKLLIEDNNTLHAKLQHLVGLHDELHVKCDALGLEWAQKEEDLKSELNGAEELFDLVREQRDELMEKLRVAETYAGWAKVAVEDRDEWARRALEAESGPNDYEAIRERVRDLTKQLEVRGQENRRLLVRIDELQLEIAAVRYSAKMYKKGAESEIHRYNTQLEQAESARDANWDAKVAIRDDFVDEKECLIDTIDELDSENVRLTAVVNSNSVAFNKEIRARQDKINAQGKELREARETYRNGATFLSTKLLEAQDALIKRDSGARGLIHDLREEIGFIYANGVRKSLGIPSLSDAIKLAKYRLTGR